MNQIFMKKLINSCLPGDFIAFKLTGEINTTKNGLSEGDNVGF
ncbi:MAG: hypothetical protein CM15mP65_28970 [Crocinitomicaceae bacterium]|nr:MAG: hypothetical protein CM15mP65_28970 [Crocinitomicaceae bacterium]